MQRLLLAMLTLVAIATSLAFPPRAEAEVIYPVCLFWKDDYTSCAYNTIEQCNQSARGIGADCRNNPAYAAPLRPGARRAPTTLPRAVPDPSRSLYPVCMFWKNDYVSCDFSTLAQCKATARGIGAECRANPGYGR